MTMKGDETGKVIALSIQRKVRAKRTSVDIFAGEITFASVDFLTVTEVFKGMQLVFRHK